MAKILITGGEGFIGRALADKLSSLGHLVKSIDISSKKTSENVVSLSFDASNTDLLEPLIAEADVVFHLAAIVGVKFYVDKPYDIFKTNFKLTETVARLCINYDKQLIFASTSEVYGKNLQMPLSEESDCVMGSTWDNRWIYAESKSFAERYLLLESKESGLKVKIFRPFNVIGPGQNPEYGSVMPKFIKSALKNEPLTVYGDGQQTRSFCYIEDMVSGIIAIMNFGKNGEVYNIGNPEETSIEDLASTVIKISNSKSSVINVEYDKIYPGYSEIGRRVPNVSKLKHLGWNHSVSLKESIGLIVDFIRKNNSVI